MPYFHATAVFEARGTSLEEADRTVDSLFKSLRHNRIYYYEHDVTAGSGPYPSSKSLYFSVIAEFDVDAYNEDRAGELTDEILETLATDDVQFIAFGLTQGEPRVRPAERTPREERAPQVEPEPEKPQETRADTGETEERKGKKRSSRGRGRKRKDDREVDGGSEAQAEDSTETVAVGEVAPESTFKLSSVREEKPTSELLALVVVTPEAEQKPVLDIRPLMQEEELPTAPPPRSSTAMQITLTMSFRASEFGLQATDIGSLDQEAFLARATAEARSRHPELPQDVVPVHEISPLPWGEIVVRLTWQYPVPVPSAAEEA
jgi:hypothetical protein